MPRAKNTRNNREHNKQLIMFATISPIINTHEDLTHECTITNLPDFDRSANTKKIVKLLPRLALKSRLTDFNPYRGLVPRRDLFNDTNTKVETNNLATMRVTRQICGFSVSRTTLTDKLPYAGIVSLQQQRASRNKATLETNRRHVHPKAAGTQQAGP